MVSNETRRRWNSEVQEFAMRKFTSLERMERCYHLWVPKWWEDRTYVKYCTNCGKVSGVEYNDKGPTNANR